MNLINLPYYFLFVPLILSGVNILQNFKTTNKIITISAVSFILGLSLYLIPEVLPNITLQNKVNNSLLFIMGEYKINLINLIFIILIFFIKLISFMFFDDTKIYAKKLNFFFAIYLINYFSICGILISDNLFNIFIYLEFYSFTLYNLMSDYKQINYNNASYRYYNNGVIGSLFFMMFIFVVYFSFNSSDMTYISNNLDLIKNNYIYNASVLLLLMAIIFKFFSFNFYFASPLKSSEITNMLFINIFFADVVLGIYVLRKTLYSLFDLNVVFNVFQLRYLFFLGGSFLIIYSAYKLYARKNLMPNIYSFSLFILGYVIILMGIDNNYSFVSMILFLMHHILIDFLFYIIVILCLFLFHKTDIPVLYAFNKYRYIIYSIVLSKMLFPIAFGFSSSWNFVLAIVEGKYYYLFIPFIIEKLSIILLFVKYYFVFCKEPRDGLCNVSIDQTINFKMDFVMIIAIIIFLIFAVSIFESNINNALFDFIKG